MASYTPSPEELTVAMRGILKGSDLSSLSSKKVRKALEAKFGGDLTERKEELDKLLMKLVAELGEEEGSSDDDESDDEEKPATSAANGTKPPKEDKDDSSDTSFTPEPPKKKAKKSKHSTPKPKPSTAKVDSDDDFSDNDNEVDDESYARQLQKEELGVRRRKTAPEKVKKSKKKDDKDKPSSSRKGTSLYSQPCVLSEELAAIMGQDRMARKDVVSNMWKIFKERQLQDPKNKQYVNCDEQLEKLFKVKKFKAFGMMKILKHHMKDEKLVHS